MLRKILVVEDDDFFRETICDVLKERFKVYQAPNGKSACEILSIQSVDLVISDIQMPGLSGIELLEWSKANKPVPFIMMTGFSTLLETTSAFEIGASDFITKPFKITDLIESIEKILAIESPESKNKKTENHISRYCKVSIDDFVSRPKIEFDVYIRLSDTNIIKIAQKNEELPKDQISHYKSKGIKHLYILKEDFGKLVQFNLDLAKVLKNHSEISAEKKVAFLKYTGEVLLEKTFTDGLNTESLQEVQTFLKITVESVVENRESFELLNVLKQYSDQLYAHSIAVSMYSVLLAKQLGFESSLTLFKLSMAGLLQDMGLKEIDPEILKKPRHLLSKEERREFESHPLRSYEILLSIKSMPGDVCRLVYEHHEDQEGLGFPLKKNKKEQHPISRILQCAGLFIDYIEMEKENSSEDIRPLDIIAHLERIYTTRIDPECLAALKCLFDQPKAS